MKKALASLLLMSLLLLVSGCAQATPSSSFTQQDFYLSIDGTQYRCKDNIQTVIENLGDEYTYSDGLSCAYDGLDKTYAYDMAEFYTNPLPDGDLVSEIYTENPDVTTSMGIAVGATKAEVLSAYGEDGDDTGTIIIYRLPDSKNETKMGSLCFEIEDELVIAIFITTEPV